MTLWLKQSTAVEIPLGPFVDSTDGVTAETALTLTQADVRIKKGGGSWAQKGDASSATHEENGYYEIALNTTDTNTLGRLRVAVNESGALPVWQDFMVVPANVYDSLVGGSDTLQADVAQWNGTAVPAENTAGYPIVTVKDGTGTGEIDTTGGGVLVAAMAANALTASALAADAVAEIQSGLATAAALATVDGIVDDILLDTAQIGTAGAGLTALPWNAAWDTEVQSEAADALSAYDPPTKAELDSAVAPLATQATALTIAGYVDTEVAAIKAKTDNLPSDPADQSAVEAAITAATSSLATIQAKTDNLPASPAAVGSAMTLAANAVTASALATDAVNEIADGTLKRDWTAISGEPAEFSLWNAARFMRGLWNMIGSVLHVYKEDGATDAWTSDMTTNPDAAPITGSDTV